MSKTRIIVERTRRKWGYKSRLEKKKKKPNNRIFVGQTRLRVSESIIVNLKTKTEFHSDNILLWYGMKRNPERRRTQLPVVNIECH